MLSLRGSHQDRSIGHTCCRSTRMPWVPSLKAPAGRDVVEPTEAPAVHCPSAKTCSRAGWEGVAGCRGLPSGPLGHRLERDSLQHNDEFLAQSLYLAD